MHLRGAATRAGLLVGPLLVLLTGPVTAGALAAAPASSGVPAVARAASLTGAPVPPVVTAGEPSVLAGRVRPAGPATVVVERRVGETWTPYAEVGTDARGRYRVDLDTAARGRHAYRVSAPGSGRARLELRVTAPGACRSDSADPAAAPEVHCLLRRLDRWHRAGLMGVGQQLNVSNLHYRRPLTELAGEPVSVVGFDLAELADGQTYQFPEPPLDGLLDLAAEGAVLAATWHAPDPLAEGDRLRDLLDPATPAAERFWADYDEVLGLLGRLGDGDGGRFAPAPVVFRPLHEANGSWFWWGDPRPRVYRQLWSRLQQRAAAAGVHNLVWAYSANRWTRPSVSDPRRLLPARVDLGGLDSYDPEAGPDEAPDRLPLEGWSRVAGAVDRAALTEVGPHGSADGDWDPAVVTRTVRREGLRPLWAMFWFDDGDGADGVSGRKQLSSLTGGRSWLRSCPGGLCRTGS